MFQHEARATESMSREGIYIYCTLTMCNQMHTRLYFETCTCKADLFDQAQWPCLDLVSLE